MLIFFWCSARLTKRARVTDRHLAPHTAPPLCSRWGCDSVATPVRASDGRPNAGRCFRRRWLNVSDGHYCPADQSSKGRRLDSRHRREIHRQPGDRNWIALRTDRDERRPRRCRSADLDWLRQWLGQRSVWPRMDARPSGDQAPHGQGPADVPRHPGAAHPLGAGHFCSLRRRRPGDGAGRGRARPMGTRRHCPPRWLLDRLLPAAYRGIVRPHRALGPPE